MLCYNPDGMKAVPMNESEGGYQHLTGFDRVRGNRTLGGCLSWELVGDENGIDNIYLSGGAAAAFIIGLQIGIADGEDNVNITYISPFAVSGGNGGYGPPRLDEVVKAAIKRGNYTEAVQLIIEYFSDLRSVNPKFYQFSVLPGVNTTRKIHIDESAETGEPEDYCDIIYSKEDLDNFKDGYITFGSLVRTVYHELIHVNQLMVLKMDQEDQRPQREFLAYYESLTNSTLPSMNAAEKSFFANTNFTIQTILTDKGPMQFGNYYNRLSPGLKNDYKQMAEILRNFVLPSK